MILPKVNAYVKSYEGKTEQMYFFIEDKVFFLKNKNLIR